MRRARVLIADDHAIVLEGLVGLLEDAFDVVGSVADGSRLVAEAVRLRPDVIITDLSMPVMGGLEAIRHLKRAWAEARVIVLTMHADPQLASEALRAGAAGFVAKHAAGDELVRAIDEALSGRVYVTPPASCPKSKPLG